MTCPSLKYNRTLIAGAALGAALGVSVGLGAALGIMPNAPALAQAQEVQDARITTPSASGAAADQNQLTLTAIPPRYGDDGTLLLKPGESEQIQLRVRNSSAQSITILTQVFDFIIGDDGETPIPIEADDEVSNRWSLANWVTLVPQSQTIEPNQTVAVNALIQVPEDALPGGHYAMVLHEPLPAGTQVTGDAQAARSAASISQQVGTLVYVIVEGPINEEAFIRDFEVPGFSEYGPVPFSFVVENRSDVHIQPKVKIEIFDWFGKKVGELGTDEKNIFPLLHRGYTAKWDQIWGYGRYTAQVTMSFGTQGQVVIANTSFWLLPITLILAGLVGILVLIALIIVIRRHLQHRGDMSQEKIAHLEERLKELEGDKLKQYEE